jgi:hypothetical protein
VLAGATRKARAAQVIEHPLPVCELPVVQRMCWANRETLQQRPRLGNPSSGAGPFTEKAIEEHNAAGHRRLVEDDDIQQR